MGPFSINKDKIFDAKQIEKNHAHQESRQNIHAEQGSSENNKKKGEKICDRAEKRYHIHAESNQSKKPPRRKRPEHGKDGGLKN